MRKVETTIYKYEELSEKAREKVFDRFKDTLIDWNAESLKDVYEERLSELHYPKDDIRWRLSSCQGDGMAFYGHVYNDDVKEIAKRLMSEEDFNKIESEVWNNIKLSINKSGAFHMYDHFNTMIVQIESNSEFDELERLEDLISEDVKSVSIELEDFGYSYLDPSKEEIEEQIKEAEEEYYADGRKFIYEE